MMVSVVIMYVLSYQGIWFYTSISLFPFVAGGLLLASITQEQGDRIRTIYFADLAGAGAGAAASIPLMNMMGPVETLSLISALLFFISFVLALHTIRRPYQAMAWIVMVLLVYNAVRPFAEWIPFRAYMTSPSNIMASESGAKLVFTQWDAYSRTDVYDAGDGELLYITLDGGAVSPISKYAGDLKQVDYLRSTTGFLAFQGIGKERALIIGACGGQDALAAQIAGFRQIEAVDINSGSFNAVRKLAAFSGNPFAAPQIKPVIADGRSYIRQTENQYDLIFLSLVKKASENGMALALMENYLFTQEAIGEYLSKLKPGGRLAFLLHEENELAKVVTATERVLEESGVAETEWSRRMAVIGTYQHLGHPVWGMGGSRITRPLLLIGKEPLSVQSARELTVAARNMGQIPIHVPYVYDNYTYLMKEVIQSEDGLSSNRDDKPFFYNRSDSAPLSLIWSLIVVLAITLLLVRTTRYPYGRAVYFSGIAIGFMALETTLVQRLVLPLAHPALSFVVVLGTLLTAGGIGSLLSLKWQEGRHDKRFAPLLWTAVYGIVANIAMTAWSDDVLHLALIYKILMAMLLLIPLGFFMGMAFPYGISRSSERHRALGWAINGIMTAAGSLISVILSLTFGFAVTMAAGAAIYGALYFLQPALGFDLSK
ncbi:class I SAM-dependent methyltransferase [Cohnella algarum]|uniref:class I SAM-dependent methyltransferase n=1 Tax=Cohnella algarum TaxID=2044859 RepID=UPI001966DB6A|nr:class I SAM-dependent methyltransferase [Cohnella algarum]MBN2981777.1 spermine synthase [Cohnella algarum]